MDPKLYRQTRCSHGWVDDSQCKACKTEAERDALRLAVRKLMDGCEFKTLQGCEAWHSKTMPTDSALDAGRHALALGDA